MTGQRTRTTAAFTIVEILVVIGVLALLLGMLLPALSGAKKRSLKHKELNSIRQVGFAWTLYANSSNDKILPGYLEVDVQSRWRVSYEYPNHKDIPPAPSYTVGDVNNAGPWTWRLMPFMSFDHDVVHGYTDEPGFDAVTLGTDLAEASAIAYQPAFGYNAFYVGGWWEMDGNHARHRFFDATVNGVPSNVVSRSIGTIRRSTELLIFCSSAVQSPGRHSHWKNTEPGSHFVVPPILAADPQWKIPGADSFGGTGANNGASGAAHEMASGTLDPGSIDVVALGGASAPIGRHNGLAATLFADNHTDALTPGALLSRNAPIGLPDLRTWIDRADTIGTTSGAWGPGFRHD